MGEIADMMLDGTMCQQCGVYIEEGEPLGIPRSCSDCIKEEKKNRKPSTGKYAVKGVMNFLKSKEIKNTKELLDDYNAKELQIPKNEIKICEEIQKDFKRFNRWFNKNKKIYLDESRS